MDAVNFGDEAQRGFWAKARKLAGKLPFMKDAAALYFAMLDPKTSPWAKAAIAAALAYVVSPVDAIPDVLIGLGYTDDAAVVASTIGVVSSNVTDAHRKAAEDAFS